MSNWVLIAEELTLEPGCGVAAWLDGVEWAIFRDREDWFAIEGRCPHKGAPLADGTLEDGQVACPWHGWKFDGQTGSCTDHPGFQVRRTAVRVDDERRVWIDQPPEVPQTDVPTNGDVDQGLYHLVRYSRLGWVGVFSAAETLECQLRERVVVETTRGLELGEFLGAARVAEANKKSAGSLVRLASADDLARTSASESLVLKVIQSAQDSAVQMQLPIEIVDGEVLCDGTNAILYYVGEFVPEFAVLRTEIALQYQLSRIDLVSILEPEAKSGCGTSCGSGCGH